MSKEIPNYWKAAIKMGRITEKEYWEKVEPCHILIMRAKERQKKRLIEVFIERWNVLLEWCNDVGFDYEMYKGNIKNYIKKEIEKWEAKAKES